ncbi:unnamed protein product [Prorocentrum cordatum]|uniref:RRM domain-containing protein n=1 Tax=Prorocentrum cordatum TaxID=2364126 RepID=A0ABN9RTD0_9DINO|nr:unnamed protein product [Polarella glacialis]
MQMENMDDMDNTEVESKMENMDARLTHLETSSAGSRTDAEVREQLKMLEAQISELKLMDNTQKSNGNQYEEYTAVVGGLQTIGSTENAKKWIEANMWDLYGPQPAEVYSKGEFRGLIFVRFRSRADRDTAVKLLRQASLKEGGNDIWAKRDMVLPKRILTSFAFSVKHLLKQWGFTAESVWADPEGTVWVGADVAVSGRIVGNKFETDFGTGWEEWFKQDGYTNFQDLVANLNAKLGKIPSKGLGKGKGKGKAAAKGSK